MPNRKDKLPADRTEKDLVFRSMAVRAMGGVDEEKRSVDVTLVTETPVPTFDIQRYEVVDEILIVRGLELPGQIPLLDSHNRYTSRDIYGSIRELKVDGDKLVGRAFFSRKEQAQVAFDDVRDGHLTDMSVGALRIESHYIARGQSATIAGRTFTAGERTLKVTTRARVVEGSLVAVGGDPNTKVHRGLELLLRASFDPEGLREETVVDKLKELLISRGMPAETEGAAVFEWLQRHLAELQKEPPKDKPEATLDAINRALAEALKVPTAPPTNGQPSNPAPNVDEIKRAAADERKRVCDITDLCRTHNVPDADRQKWIDEGISADLVGREVLKRIAAGTTGGVPLGPGGRIEGGAAEAEKFVAAAASGLTLRCLQGAGVKVHEALERAKRNGEPDAIQRSQQLVDLVAKPAPGADDFRYVRLSDVARMFLERAGHRVFGLPQQEIVRRAFQLPGLLQRADAFHTTGSFPQLMLDAANKTLLAGYDEAPTTYQIWSRIAPSASDFKELNRIRFGELPDPEIVPEGHPYPEKRPSDNRERYRVEKHGEIFSITLEAVVNDDLNAISRIPAMQGAAMRRKINKTVYAILTSNPTLSDNIALFHATSHGANLDATVLAAGAPLDTGYNVMMTQTGLSGTGTILNITPRYLIVPAALSATALQITAGQLFPATVGNKNLYGTDGPRTLVPVVDGQLDGSSTTAWWLACDPMICDTIEVTFLSGEESPVLSREDGFEVDCVKYKIRQTFQAAAIDFRGLYQGNS